MKKLSCLKFLSFLVLLHVERNYYEVLKFSFLVAYMFVEINIKTKIRVQRA